MQPQSVFCECLTDIEKWEKLYIPFLAPILAFAGAVYIFKLKFRKSEQIERNKKQESLKLIKSSVIDNIDLTVILARRNLESLDKLKENLDFKNLKNLPVSIFDNEGIHLLSNYSKSDLDAIYSRKSISGKEHLLVYGQFLSSRILIKKMYDNLNTWGDNYQLKAAERCLNFDKSFSIFLHYLNKEIHINRLDSRTLDTFKIFVDKHSVYSGHPTRYLEESEISVVDNLLDELIKELKNNGVFYKLHEFEKYYLDLENSINTVRRNTDGNLSFLNSIADYMKIHLSHIIKFDQLFNKADIHLGQS